MSNTVICTAGHRPDRLGGYTPEVATKLMVVARLALDTLQPSKLVCGMCIGWDLALGLAAVQKGVPIVCAVPFYNHAQKYSPTAKTAAQRIYDASIECVYVLKQNLYEYQNVAAAFRYRNEWMVEHSDAVAALWCGDKHSGTWHCMNTAMKQGKPVTNFWAEWAGAS